MEPPIITRLTKKETAALLDEMDKREQMKKKKQKYYVDEYEGIVHIGDISKLSKTGLSQEDVLEEIQKWKKVIIYKGNDLYDKIPEGTTHLHFSISNFTNPLGNLPSTLVYLSRNYKEDDYCSQGCGYEYQLNNFPHGLKVLILVIDIYSSMLNLPQSLEYIFLIDGYHLGEIDKANPKTILVPSNVKVFAITEYLSNAYNIVFENEQTQKIIIADRTGGYDYFSSDYRHDWDLHSHFIEYLPLEYHDFYRESLEF